MSSADAKQQMTGAQRRDMGHRALALVKQRYRWPDVARQVLEVYTWLLASGPPPGFVE